MNVETFCAMNFLSTVMPSVESSRSSFYVCRKVGFNKCFKESNDDRTQIEKERQDIEVRKRRKADEIKIQNI
jgi:hypothetical protein